MTDNIARLLALMGGSGGSGGTTDYEDLNNKPSIGGTTLIGDLTLAELGIIVDDQLNLQSTNPVQNAVLTALLNAFPYSNVTGKPQINGVTLTGNITLGELGLNAIWVGTSAEFEIDKDTIANGTLIFITDNDIVDSVPTQNSTNLVESGGVYSFVMGGLSDKVDKVNGKGLSTEDYTTAEKTKLAGIEDEATRTWVGTSAEYMQQASSIPVGTPIIITDDVDTDATPTQNSTNPVQSGGVYAALADKVDKVIGKQLSTEDFTTAYKKGLSVMMENPENHNGIYRGKDLSDVYTWDEIYERVHDGSFEDLYLGDYKTLTFQVDLYTRYIGETFESGVTYYEVGGIPTARTFTPTSDQSPQAGKKYATKQTITETVDFMIAAFDYYYMMGRDYPAYDWHKMTNHHIIILPKAPLTPSVKWVVDATEFSEGYNHSDLRTITLGSYDNALKTALNNHILSFYDFVSSQVNSSTPSNFGAGTTGAVTNVGWTYMYGAIMTPTQLTGETHASSDYETLGTSSRKFDVFNFVSHNENNNSYTFLRNVAYEDFVYLLGSYGTVTVSNSVGSTACKIQPYWVFG